MNYWDQRRLRAIDRAGVITEADMKGHPTLHFCPEWDGLVIDITCDEYEACLCGLTKASTTHPPARTN